jgi:hypothetical protein
MVEVAPSRAYAALDSRSQPTSVDLADSPGCVQIEGEAPAQRSSCERQASHRIGNDQLHFLRSSDLNESK